MKTNSIIQAIHETQIPVFEKSVIQFNEAMKQECISIEPTGEGIYNIVIFKIYYDDPTSLFAFGAAFGLESCLESKNQLIVEG